MRTPPALMIALAAHTGRAHKAITGGGRREIASRRPSGSISARQLPGAAAKDDPRTSGMPHCNWPIFNIEKCAKVTFTRPEPTNLELSATLGTRRKCSGEPSSSPCSCWPSLAWVSDKEASMVTMLPAAGAHCGRLGRRACHAPARPSQ